MFEIISTPEPDGHPTYLGCRASEGVGSTPTECFDQDGPMGRPSDIVERARTRTQALARAGSHTAGFAEQLVHLLQPLIPHAASCVVTVDPATTLLTGTYKFGGLTGEHGSDVQWAQLEYGFDDPTRMAVVARQPVPACATSHLPGGSQDSIRIRNLVGPAGYSDELRMVARNGEQPWGGVNLFRAADEAPFSEDEVSIIAALSEAVADGLRAGVMARCAVQPDTTSARGGPAVLILDRDAHLQRVSLGTEELLAELTTDASRSPADSMIQALVAAARRYATGESDTFPRTRLRLPTGRWLVAQAAPLADADGHTCEVVVTIDEARPPEIVTLLASAFGLTDREREVTQLVLRGTDTKGIATELSMSGYTVQDHLKSVFDKADVRSRRELMARVFFDQYTPRLTNDTGPTGWFLPSSTTPAAEFQRSVQGPDRDDRCC